MKTRGGWLVSAVLFAAVPVLAGEKAEIGKPAPEFTLTGVDGKEVKLADLKGKVVVLEWINHECPVVNRCYKAGTMKSTIAKFKDKPVVWLAIDSSHFAEEKAETIKKWIGEQGIEHAYLLDAPGKVGKAFDAKTTPHMFVIDQKGILAYTGAIDNDPYGNEPNKINYVEQAIQALLDGSTVATATTKSYGCTVKFKPTAGG
jgi:peroxiredoxin